jgi:cytochrome c5
VLVAEPGISAINGVAATSNADTIGDADAIDNADGSEASVLIYNQTCVVCHDEGVHGAPRPGVKSDWESPLSYGLEEIYINTLEGIGEMPPRGLCDDCTGEQLKAVVDFMLAVP